MLTRRQRRERTEKEAFWGPHLTAWQSSGMSVKAYCKENGLKSHQFKYWQVTLASESTVSKHPSSPDEPDFVELKPILSPEPTPYPSWEIKTKNGLSITFTGVVDAEIVKTVLTQIKEAV